MLSKLILTTKIMGKKNFKIQMLAGNRLKIRVVADFEISSTLCIIRITVTLPTTRLPVSLRITSLF